MPKRSDFNLKLDKRLKSPIFLAAVLIIIISLLYGFYNSIEPSEPATQTTTQPFTTTIPQTTTKITTTTIPQPTVGNLVILFKDEDQKIPGGGVLKSVNFTVNKVEVLPNESEEWVEVFSGEKTLNLLEYTSTYAKIEETEMDVGSYEKIRISLSDGHLSLTNILIGIYRPKTYTLDVQEETTVEYNFEIKTGDTLNLIMDFDVPNSVQRIGIGYMFSPSIHISEQSGELENMEEI